MKILAVVNCKAKKRDYPTTAEDMYWPSKMFRMQVEFIREAYANDYIIVSALKGVTTPTETIDPYNITMKKAKLNSTADVTLTSEEKDRWAQDIVNNPIFEKYDEIHLHIGNDYHDPLSKYLSDKFIHVKQPRTPGLVITRYQEAKELWLSEQRMALAEIGEYRPSLYPEQRKNWMHVESGEFFGYSRDLVKAFPEQNLDEGTLYRVDKHNDEGQHPLSVPHSKGWCVQKDVLERLHKTYDKNGRIMWRLSKSSAVLPI